MHDMNKKLKTHKDLDVWRGHSMAKFVKGDVVVIVFYALRHKLEENK